jgi:hypothetical protein
MNLEGHRNCVVGTGWQIAFGNLSSFISTFAFPANDIPTYRLGYSLGLGLLSMSTVAVILYYILRVMHDKRLELGQKKLVL